MNNINISNYLKGSKGLEEALEKTITKALTRAKYDQKNLLIKEISGYEQYWNGYAQAAGGALVDLDPSEDSKNWWPWYSLMDHIVNLSLTPANKPMFNQNMTDLARRWCRQVWVNAFANLAGRRIESVSKKRKLSESDNTGTTGNANYVELFRDTETTAQYGSGYDFSFDPDYDTPGYDPRVTEVEVQQPLTEFPADEN